MNFRKAVAGTSALKDAYQDGLQGLRKADRAKIVCAEPRRLTGSVDVDKALADLYPNDPRWDYGIGVRKGSSSEHVVWVEVHPATTHGANEVYKKYVWFKQWLASSAPLLANMTGQYVWIASGEVAIPPNSPHRRRLAAQGILFAGRKFSI